MKVIFLAVLSLALLGVCSSLVHAVFPTILPPDLLVLDGQNSLVELAPFAQLIGARVTRNGDVLTITRGKEVFICVPGQTGATANGKSVTSPIAPYEVNGTIYIPFEPMVKALGGNARRDENGVRSLVKTDRDDKSDKGKNSNKDAQSLIRVTFHGLPKPLLLMKCTISVNQQQADAPLPSTAEILKQFHEQEGDLGHLYAMYTDGTSLHRVSFGVFGNSLPIFSRDGSRWLITYGISNAAFMFETGSYYGTKPEMRNLMQLGGPFSVNSPLLIPGALPSLSSKGDCVAVTGCDIRINGKTMTKDNLKKITDEASNEAKFELSGETALYRVAFDGSLPVLLLKNAIAQCWSPDDALIACMTAGDEPQVVVLDTKLPTPGLIHHITLGTGEMPVFSPDGKNLLFVKEPEDEVVVCHFGKTPEEYTLSTSHLQRDKTHSYESLQAIFSPDGQSIILSGGDYAGGLRRMSLDATQVIQLTDKHDDFAPVCSPDGKYIYFLRGEQICRLILTTKEVSVLGTVENAESLAVSPDGREIYIRTADQLF